MNVKKRLKKRTQRDRREGQRIEDVEVEEEQEVKTFKRRSLHIIAMGGGLVLRERREHA